MPRYPSAQGVDAERAELQSVISALARWPRLSELLRYLGDKLLSGNVDEINEYNIATDVLGRSKTVFDSAEDAIARVETHRLRKRLAEFYKGEGIDHPIQVSIPAGSYVPVFIQKPEEERTKSSPALPVQSASDVQKSGRLFQWSTLRGKYSILSACILLAFLGIAFYFYAAHSRKEPSAISSLVPASASDTQSALSQTLSGPIRLLAGYSGPPRTDSAGTVWNPDQFFVAGGTWQRGTGSISRTSDPFIFEHSRTGDFSYKIPLKPGSYELHLFFSTPVRSVDAISTFNVYINQDWALRGFDINSDTLGDDIADERVFRDVSPDKDGFLTIQFAGANGPPTLNALEVLPGVPHAQLPIRLITQATPLTDHFGKFWHSDNYFMNGRITSQTHSLSNSPDPDLFSAERYGHFTYAIPVDPRGTYAVVLHFVEFYFNTPVSGDQGRLFKVMCNGQILIDNFDIFKEAGNLREVSKTFHHLKASAQGKLNLTFEPIVNNATISGIEVLDESK